MSLKATCVVWGLKILIILMNVVTLPIFTIIDRPWSLWVSCKKEYAFNDGDGPAGPYARNEDTFSKELKKVKTLDQLIRRSCSEFEKEPAFASREVKEITKEKQKNGKIHKKMVLGDYNFKTYGEFNQSCNNLCKAFLSMGIRPNDLVGIFAETSYEWMLCAQACFRTSIGIVTMYATLSDAEITHILTETEITVLITCSSLLSKVANILKNTTTVQKIVCIENEKMDRSILKNVECITFDELMKRETDKSDSDIVPPRGRTTAVVMYTSGSSGQPKGVLLSHLNLVRASLYFSVYIDPGDKHIAYLPLAHVFELSIECALLRLGGRVFYSSPLTLMDNSTGLAKGQVSDIMLVKPSKMIAVPLILEKIHNGVLEQFKAKGEIMQEVLLWIVEYKSFWNYLGYQTPIVDRFVFSKTSHVLGGALKFIVCGSAALNSTTQKFLSSVLCCKLLQGYGLTETTATGTSMNVCDTSRGRVGPPVGDMRLLLKDWPEGEYYSTDKPNPRGEIILGGSTVAKGYFKNEELTKESFFEDENGFRWFNTGDIGEVFQDGTLKIIDRKKDIIKLSNGEFIPVSVIETAALKCAWIDNICVYADSTRDTPVALVCPKIPVLLDLARDCGKDLDIQVLSEDKEVRDKFIKEITKVLTEEKFSKNQIPSNVFLCLDAWIPETGLVSATFKNRRKNIYNFYKEEIAKMYENT